MAGVYKLVGRMTEDDRKKSVSLMRVKVAGMDFSINFYEFDLNRDGFMVFENPNLRLSTNIDC